MMMVRMDARERTGMRCVLCVSLFLSLRVPFFSSVLMYLI